MTRRTKLATWLALCAALPAACSAKHDLDVVRVPASVGGVSSGGVGVSGSASGDSASGGSAGGNGVMGGVAAGGAAGGSVSLGGFASVGGVASEAGGAGAGGDGGAAPECPRGTLLGPHVPADCLATACDGRGGVIAVTDFDNRPAPQGDCWVGTCDAQSKPQQIPSAAGDVCQSAGGKLCDGEGNCVACLTQADCAAGACIEHACVQTSCSNGQRDAGETDVDCGGFCPQCTTGQSCKIDQDCASDSCEPVKLTCLPASCVDAVQNNGETDVDCGGPDCSPCYVRKKCQKDSDCATNKCIQPDGICGGEPCIDKRLDGTESDVDCGGFYCHWCKAGQRCNANYDCAPGHYCNAKQQPAVCVPYP